MTRTKNAAASAVVRLGVLVVLVSVTTGCTIGSRGERNLGDPFRPMNETFFTFNDKMYFWVLRPVATGYGYVVPRPARRGVRSFFSNLGTPMRVFGCVLQAQFRGAGTEVARFGINTTVGVLGFWDPARGMGLKQYEEDTGQAFAVWGIGPGFYLNLPFLGPSTLRDAVGGLFDLVLNPTTYLPGLNLVNSVNSISLNPDDYPDLKEAALDPYIAVRNAYWQNRQHLVQERSP